LKEVWRQLSGIGGGRSLGFGPNRVRSLPDGLAQVLAEYLEETSQIAAEGYADSESYASSGNGHNLMTEAARSMAIPAEQVPLKFGDLCPECGQAAVVNEEGCRKCYACGFSEC
jgi:ribonucleoside-diphosphate reductase alpha chain